MKLFAQTRISISHPHVMGILNVTPDSFSDGGTHNTLIEAVKHANLMINAGQPSLTLAVSRRVRGGRGFGGGRTGASGAGG